MRADPAANRRNRIVSQDDLQRLVEPSLCDQSHIALRALMDGASGLAGRGSAARNAEYIGNRLRERPEDRLPLSQSLIEFGRQRDWTVCRASAATRAFRRVNKTRLLLDADREIPRLAFDAFHLTQGENLDVLVPADLDQARRHGAHRAIVGGKSLVELRHDSANGRATLGQIHLDAAVREIEGCLHAANTASYN